VHLYHFTKSVFIKKSFLSFQFSFNKNSLFAILKASIINSKTLKDSKKNQSKIILVINIFMKLYTKWFIITILGAANLRLCGQPKGTRMIAEIVIYPRIRIGHFNQHESAPDLC
jgi:hypothetical protein